MNCAFALAYLCEHEPGLRKILALPESSEMVSWAERTFNSKF